MMILLVAACFTGFAANAQTDTASIDYRYYPEVNVYFNPKTRTYSWFDQNSATWTTGVQLPASLKVRNEATFNTIRYPGTDIWSANPDHIKIYGNKNTPIPPVTTPPKNTTPPPPRK